ncbi:MAG: Fic family protein [Buchananella hordeovulneris]|nr:Fic family protein [Buchananella hordeovulneris]
MVRDGRRLSAHPTPFTLVDGTPLTYNIPAELLRLIEEIARRAAGSLQTTEPSLADSPRQYLLTSLQEEAITSSQLEGASTTRAVAKEMLRNSRKPKDKGEQMVANNFAAMQLISRRREAPLTPEFVCELHRVLTEGTLPAAEAGRLQQPDEERVRIYADHTDEQVLHIPPPATELPGRLQGLCDFANAGRAADDSPYTPPLIRSMILHFMVGHDHYFSDGNGRLARAIFYWSMLHHGFFLTEYLSISRLLRQAPAQYARAFLHVEYDEGDLTHFLLHQARIVVRAIDDLETYLSRKEQERRALAPALAAAGFNSRQRDLIASLLRNPAVTLNVTAHQERHEISNQSARTDLQGLEEAGLLLSKRRGRRVEWWPVADFATRIRRLTNS